MEGFAVGGGADVDFAFGEAGFVEGVEGLAHFHHHVVGDIDDVIDGADADRLEAGAEPVGAGADFYAADAAGGVERAEARGVDGDAGAGADGS